MTCLDGLKKNSKVICYTDGSYKKNKDGEYGVGWGYVMLDEEANEILHEEYGSYNEYMDSRQIGGELYAVVRLVQYCEEHGVDEVEIRHDYLGCCKWYDGSWKCKKELTQRYREFMLDSPIKITFTHVKAHNGNKWNEYVDALAKRAIDGGEV